MPKKKKLAYSPDPADERKHKEGWSDPEPGIVAAEDGHSVGKCPQGMSIEEAQGLLERGIRVAGRRRRSPYPERVYNVRKGVPYQAHQKRPGRYHGFPELPSRIPPSIREELRARAAADGHLEEYETWRATVDDHEE